MLTLLCNLYASCKCGKLSVLCSLGAHFRLSRFLPRENPINTLGYRHVSYAGQYRGSMAVLDLFGTGHKLVHPSNLHSLLSE